MASTDSDNRVKSGRHDIVIGGRHPSESVVGLARVPQPVPICQSIIYVPPPPQSSTSPRPPSLPALQLGMRLLFVLYM